MGSLKVLGDQGLGGLFKVQGSGLVQGVVLVASETRKFEDASIRAVPQGVPKKRPEAGLQAEKFENLLNSWTRRYRVYKDYSALLEALQQGRESERLGSGLGSVRECLSWVPRGCLGNEYGLHVWCRGL